MARKPSKRQETYLQNKKAKVGNEIVCPICGQTFTKRQWQQAFCCNDCKNKYWNAKGDRHSSGYYEEYDLEHPSRLRNRIVYGSSRAIVIGATTNADREEIAIRIAGIANTLDRYTDTEVKKMYENHKYGMHPHLTEQTMDLFGQYQTVESCHPFDIDGQMAECEF